MAIKLRNTISNISAGTTSMTLNISCNIGDTIVLSFWCRDVDFTISSGWNLVFKHNIQGSSSFQPHGTFYKTATSTTETVTITQASGRLMMCLSAFYSDVGGAVIIQNDASAFLYADSPTIIPKTINFTRGDAKASIFHLGGIAWSSGEWTTSPNDLTRLLTVTSDRSGVFWDDGTKTKTRSFSVPMPDGQGYALTRTILQEQITLEKFLLQSEDVYYTIAAGSLQVVEIPELNAQAFSDFGFDSIPGSDLLKTLQNPKVLYWQDSEDELPALQANVNALPPVQTIEHDVDMNHPSIQSIKEVSSEFVGLPLIAFSKDGVIWQHYNGTAWVDGFGQIPAHTGPILETWRAGAKNFKIQVRIGENDALKLFKIQFQN